MHRALHRDDKVEFAIKEIDKKLTNNQDRLNKEINILSLMDHANIIRFKEVFQTKTKIFLVTELAEGGELFDRIMERDHYCEKHASVLVEHILSAISYMHSYNFVHRDLKPENILLKSKDDDTTIKIIDFGLATVVGETPLRAACGTPMYSAPEVIDAKRRGYGLEADLWSIGVITYILLCGYPPFVQNDNETIQQLFQKILSGKVEYNEEEWKDVSDDAKDFLSRLLLVNPKERMTAKEALEHPWILNHSSSPHHDGEAHSLSSAKPLLQNFSKHFIKNSVEVPHDADSDAFFSEMDSSEIIILPKDIMNRDLDDNVLLTVL